LDRGELFLVPGQDQLASVPGGVLGDGGQVGQGDHRGLVGHDQRAGQDPPGGEVGEQPGGVGRGVDPGVAQAVGGVLGCRGANYRPVPGLGEGGQDRGLAGTGRACDHFGGPGRGERVPRGGRLVQAQPARRVVLARDAGVAGQCRLQLREIGAETPRGQLAGQPRRTLSLGVCDQFVFHRQLRGGGVSRGAEPRVDAAAVQLAAQRRGQRRPLRSLQAHHLTGPAGQGLLREAEQQLLRFLRTQVTGLRGQHQGKLLEQVVPGPGGMLVRYQGQGLG
jgi:hypothetical protein